MFLKLERSAPGWPIREVVSEEPGEIQGCLWLLICVFPQPNTDTKLTPEKVCALSQTQRGRTYVLSVLKSPCLCLVIHGPALLFWDSSWLTAERCQLWLQKPLEESRVPSRAMFSLLPAQQSYPHPATQATMATPRVLICVSLIIFMLTMFSFLLFEGEKRGGREIKSQGIETHVRENCRRIAFRKRPDRRLSLRPRYVLWPEIEPAGLGCTRQSSKQLSPPARAGIFSCAYGPFVSF